MLNCLRTACRNGDMKGIKSISEKIPDCDKYHVMTTCLIEIIETKFSENQIEIIDFLLKNGASTSENSTNGNTILHTAVLAGAINVVEWILENEVVFVDALNNSGDSPLQLFAKKTANFEIAKLLIEHGADIHKYFYSNEIDARCNLLCCAAFRGDVLFAELLIEHNAVVNAWSSYIDFDNFYVATPLDYALRNNQVAMVKLLLTHGADIVHQCWYSTPIKTAISTGRRELVEIILHQSLTYSQDVREEHFNAVARSNFKDLVFTVLKTVIQKKVKDLINLQFDIDFPEDNFAYLFSKLGLDNYHNNIDDVIQKGLAFINVCDYVPRRNNEAEFKKSVTLFGHTFNFGCSKTQKIPAAVSKINSLLNASKKVSDCDKKTANDSDNKKALSNGELSGYIRKLP